MLSTAVNSAPSVHPGLAEVYDQHHAFVWRVLRHRGVPVTHVDDAVHDVFLVVARRLHEFEGRASIRTWLYAIVMRVALEANRKIRRERERRLTLLRRTAHVAQADEPHHRSDAADTLRQLLEHVEPGRREVFVLSELEGMTAPEIGAALGLKVPTVYSRLRLARRDIERIIAKGKVRQP